MERRRGKGEFIDSGNLSGNLGSDIDSGNLGSEFISSGTERFIGASAVTAHEFDTNSEMILVVHSHRFDSA